MTEDIRNNIIYDILLPSLRRLYEMDYDNIRFGVSERNICGRLAQHMETIMCEMNYYKDYYADVEYNRKNDGTGKNWESHQKVPHPMVSDIIVHKRNAEPNLMAIEMKRWDNYDKRKEDRERLASVVSSPNLEERRNDCIYDTTLGVFIIYSPKAIRVEFYESVHVRGQKIGELHFDCRTENNRFLSLEQTSEIWEQL